jgi:phenylalanyl-tRNA synthetase beta chain
VQRIVAAFELNLDALIDSAHHEVKAAPVGVKPAATQDLSLVIDEKIPAGDVYATVVADMGELLEHAVLTDDYRGAGIPEGMKSLTFALRFRADDRTLTAAEANEAKARGVAAAAKKWGASIRE